MTNISAIYKIRISEMNIYNVREKRPRMCDPKNGVKTGKQFGDLCIDNRVP